MLKKDPESGMMEGPKDIPINLPSLPSDAIVVVCMSVEDRPEPFVPSRKTPCRVCCQEVWIGVHQPLPEKGAPVCGRCIEEYNPGWTEKMMARLDAEMTDEDIIAMLTEFKEQTPHDHSKEAGGEETQDPGSCHPH